jgi:hypothetical protein
MKNLKTILTKIKTNTRLMYICLILILLNVLIVVKVEISIYLLIIVTGYLISRLYLDQLSFFEHLAITPFTTPILLIIYIAFVDIIKIPINTYSIGLGILFVELLIIYKAFYNPVKKPLKELTPNILDQFPNIQKFIKANKFDILALFITLCTILAKVGSIWNFETPIMHDPIAHSTWTLKIINDKAINYFYSPGLHILAAVSQLFNSFFAPKQILLLTNFFQALWGITAYIWINKQYKNKWWALLSLIILSFGQYPAKFFYSAGKNALITAIPFLFLFFYSLNLKKNKLTILIQNLVLISIILIHYPTAIFAIIYLVAYLLTSRNNIMAKFTNVISFVPSGIWGIIWALKKYPYRLIELKNVVSTNHQIDRNLTDAIAYLWNSSVAHWEIKYLPFNIFWLGATGGLIFLVLSLKKKRYGWISIGTFISITIAIIILYLDVHSFDLIPRTTYIITFIHLYLSTTFLFGEIVIPYIIKQDQKFEFIGLVACVVFTLVMSILIYKNYQKVQEGANLITVSDKEAFRWINSNLQDETKIINTAYRNGNTSKPVFQTDAGAWLTVYTQNPTSMPFIEFSSKTTQEHYNLYYHLKTDPTNCTALDEFIQKGYKYYFLGGKQVYNSTKKPSLNIHQEHIQNQYYDIVFQSGNTKIYKLNGCSKHSKEIVNN